MLSRRELAAAFSPNRAVSGGGMRIIVVTQAALALLVDAALPKARILEIYLNVIEWGDGVFGAEAAARHYFATGASALGPESAARLAAMVPNPRFYDRHRNSSFLARQTERILARMPAAELP